MAVLELVDSAPVFAAPKSPTLEERRQIGSAELGRLLGELIGSAAETRMETLRAIAEQLGQLVAADAIVETFAKASLEQAAAGAGMIGEHGAKPVKAAIAAGLKAGRKRPRDLGAARTVSPIEVRRAASAALGAPHDDGRAPLARDDVDPAPPSASPPPSPPGAANPSETLASSSSFSPDPPASSAGEEGEAQTLAQIEKEAADREKAMSDCADLDHSDTDNGKRMIRYFGDKLLVRKESGKADAWAWICWADTHWNIEDGPSMAAILAQQVGDIIMEEARFIAPTPPEKTAIDAGKAARGALKAITDPDEHPVEVAELEHQIKEGDVARASVSKRRASRRKHGLATKNRGRMGAMLDCAGPHLRRSPDDFNADPMLVATRTHTLRFAQAPDLECPDPDVTRLKWACEALAEHRRSDLLTGVVPVKYDRDADCPKWRANMERFQPNEAQRRTVQQFAGLGLLGKPIQRVMFHYGTGGNFKSVFLETVTRVLGDSFAIGLPTESIVGGSDGSPGGARPDLERVFGKRMLRILELPSGVSLKADLIKKLTGGEKWPVRTLYKGFFEFVPLAKTHMSGNDYPQFDGSDGGMRRRLLVIEWPVKIAEEEQRDFDIVVGELMEEAPGILNWLIEGAIDYLENGLVVSEETRANTEDYFDEMDPTAMFIRDCVNITPGESVGARNMYQAYKAHCEANARRPIFETKFGRIMKKKFKRDDKRTHKYLDVSLHDVPQVSSSAGDDSPQSDAVARHVNSEQEF
ncbi:hypothetical protein A6X20_07055 [Bradyrhizobium elkanii]|nr:hypothetical protein A6X20_07055 [Bradyrhizobium elkanii]ODM79065.1 hypothetical protein A6452_28640 [Bradyrhizobium elkanii]